MAKIERLRQFNREYRSRQGATFPTSQEIFHRLSEIGEELNWELSPDGTNRGITTIPEGFRMDWTYVGVDLSARSFPNRGRMFVSALNYSESLSNWSRVPEVIDRKARLLLG